MSRTPKAPVHWLAARRRADALVRVEDRWAADGRPGRFREKNERQTNETDDDIK